MPQVPNSYYPVTAIWSAIINTLKSDTYISSHIINPRNSEKTIHRLPITSIEAAIPEKAIAVWFKNEVSFNRGNGLETATYKFYIDVQRQNSKQDIAIELTNKLSEDIKYTLMLNGNLSGTCESIFINEFEPVEEPRMSANLWSFLGCMLVEVTTGYQYL